MGKIYALSDIHGFKSLYDQVKEFLEPDDLVIFLGDAADRGPSGWECIKAMLDDPQFIYLLGNHDLMFARSYLGPDKEHNKDLHDWNGGHYTYDAFDEDPDEQSKFWYLKRLILCPLTWHYTTKDGRKIYFSHSGAYLPTFAPTGNMAQSIQDFVWDRKHIYDDAPEGVDLIVHGHTSIPSVIKKLNEVRCFENDKDILEEGDLDFVPGRTFYYAHYTKCDIDCSTITTGATTLFDFENDISYAFYVKGWEKDFVWREED